MAAADVLIARLPEIALERWAEVVAEALAADGVRACAVLVVDVGQTVLVDLASDQTRVPIEGTAAGDAYRRQTLVDDPSPGGSTWWVPITIRGTRLGLLRVDGSMSAPSADDVVTQAAAGLAVAMSAAERWTDLLTVRRRHKAMTLAADIQWQVLPPNTYVTPAFEVSGVLEPAYENGGDAFDHAHTAGLLSFAVLDAMGHGVEASTIAAVALASLRHSRSHGLELNEAREAADALVASQFGDSRYATALLATYDPAPRRLRWLSCGHPPLLLLRDRRVTVLDCRPSLPLGLGGDTVQVATAVLEPGDTVVAHTDGVTETAARPTPTEARQHLERLLVDHYDTRDHIAERMRKLALAVLDLHDGDLADDATMFALAVR